MGRSKGSRLKEWIKSPNALSWRLGQLSDCLFSETESRKILSANLGHASTSAAGFLARPWNSLFRIDRPIRSLVCFAPSLNPNRTNPMIVNPLNVLHDTFLLH